MRYDHGESACSERCGACGRCTSGPRANATCTDCGAGFYATGLHDQLCDECCDRRDDWVTTHELKAMKEQES